MNSQTTYGFDVAANRSDDLDKKVIEYIAGQPNLSVLDLGCGAGGNSLRLAQSGAHVTAIDLQDYSEFFSNLRTEHNLSEEQLAFRQGDVKQISNLLNGEQYVACVCQRTLHYLRYSEALKFLSELRSHVTGKLFISVSGLDTYLGESYEDKEKAVNDRFCELPPEDKEKYFIHEPICLYTKTEFTNLLAEAGWQVEEAWTSAFGNNKAVCY